MRARMNKEKSTLIQARKDVAAKLKGLSRIAVVSHYFPDADAYGSSCGLGLALEQAGKTVAFINESGLFPRYSSIPGTERVAESFPEGAWECLVVCDCGDVTRLGDKLKLQLSSFPFVINIDHHVSNTRFGDLCYVDEHASST